MDIKKYIASGILELYVAGALSEEENRAVAAAIEEYPELKKEVEEIEAAVMQLSQATLPKERQTTFAAIKENIKLQTPTDIIKMTPEKSVPRKWISFVGWAAAIVFGAGLLWMAQQNAQLEKKLETEIRSAGLREAVLQNQLSEALADYKKSKDLLAAVTSNKVTTIKLDGQSISPESYAKAYWNREDNKLYVDISGLPEAPEGKVYQLWSLKLEPLTPTSLGTLEEVAKVENDFFIIDNNNASEAFGITLEPAGGSESPTLEQLYALGVVSS
ncbi:anti-sigma factor domain-containing protein [Flavobacteriaceae bacterium M23B6Z8]